jgi:hypothetical protein
MTAPREEIEADRFCLEDQLAVDIPVLQRRHKKFQLRDQNKVGNGEAKAKLNRLIRDVLDKTLTFDFMSLDEDPKSGKRWSKIMHAMFDVNQLPNNAATLSISLAYQVLIPLMSGTLNSAETLMDQFFVALALIHEFLVR